MKILGTANTLRLVEIVGPPGVGKSTVYRALCQKWQPGCNWIYPDALLAPAKPSVTNFFGWLEYHYRLMSGKRRAKSIPVEYGLDFVSDYQELADFCWDSLSSSGGTVGAGSTGTRFRSAYFLFKDFCRYRALQQAGSKKPCVLEEGFLQKSFLVQDSPGIGAEQIERYLSLVPLPSAVIYLNIANRATITDRLRTRSKIIPSHVGKSESALEVETIKWQYTHNEIIGRLRRKHIDVLEIDGERAVDYNVREMISFLEALSLR